MKEEQPRRYNKKTMGMRFLAGFLFLTLLITPFSASASYQLFMGRNSGYDTSATGFLVPGIRNVAGATSASTSTVAIAGVAGTFSNLYAYTSANTTGTWTFTFNNNTTDTSVTCQITSGNNTCSDLAHSATVAAGDLWGIKVTRSTDTTIVPFFSIKFTPTTANETMLVSTAGVFSTSITQFANWNAWNGNPQVNSGSTLVQIPFIDAGTIDQFRVAATSSLSTGSYNLVITAGPNASDSALTCTIDTTTANCLDSTHATTTTTNTMVGLKGVPTGTPSIRTFAFAARYVSNTAGNFIFSGNCSASGTSAQYCPVIGISGNTPFSTEASSTLYAQPMVLSALNIRGNTGIGAGTRTYTLRINGVDSALTCGGAVQNCSITGQSVTINQGDLINIAETTTLSPNNEVIAFSINAGPAATTATTGRIIRLLGGVRLRGGVQLR